MKLRRWTAGEDRLLRQLARKGLHMIAIAERIPGRTYEGVRKRAACLAVEVKRHPGSTEMRRGTGAKPRFTGKRNPRVCMCCREKFLSEGIHHRLCAKCRRRGDLADGWEMVC